MSSRSNKPIRHVVLYAENEDVDLMMCERAFKAHRDLIELRTVNDGRSVIDWLEGRGSYANRAFFPMPVVLVLDSRLGDMSGLDVVRWLRQQRRFKDMAVILHVGATPLIEERDLQDLNVIAVIEKDSTCCALLDCV